MRDNWCVGFTDRYTVAAWVGNFDGSPMRDVSGVSGAAPVWLEVVNALHRQVASRAPAIPKDVVRSHVEFDAGIEPAREELFLPGTEARRIAAKAIGGGPGRIVYPGEGAILALDPDIPASVQRVRFAAQGGRGLRWQLDGFDLGAEGDAGVFWAPTPGHHALALVDGGGVEVDRVAFQVRGAPSAAAGLR